ncbi:MAG: helix-turn-helix domain-containing protein [Pseudomonadota bacterium]
MTAAALVLIGFSILAAILLLFAYLFFLPHMEKTTVGRASCALLLATLVIIQWQHLQALIGGPGVLGSRLYVICLMVAPAGFFFFSRAVLMPDRALHIRHVLNLVPIAAGFLLPLPLATRLAFVVGALYTLWFLNVVWTLRRPAARFRFELFFFSLFALLAIATLAVVFLIPSYGETVFVASYAGAIGVSFALIVAVLLCFPDLLSDLVETARLSYASSTLGGIDVDARIAVLERAMRSERLFVNEDLNLAQVAAAVDLSPHQLSELINTRFGHSFSHYVRERRVAYAKTLLLDDPKASVLSIGMSAGFRSQSNFYTAFKAVTGQTPGQYRKSAPDDAERS